MTLQSAALTVLEYLRYWAGPEVVEALQRVPHGNYNEERHLRLYTMMVSHLFDAFDPSSELFQADSQLEHSKRSQLMW